MSIKKTKTKLVKEKAVPYAVAAIDEKLEILDEETCERIRIARKLLKEGKGTLVDTSVPGELQRFLDSLK